MERDKLTMLVMTGARMWQHCLRTDIGIGSRLHCLFGLSLEISSAVARQKEVSLDVTEGDSMCGDVATSKKTVIF